MGYIQTSTKGKNEVCGRVSCSENAELVSASENNTLVENKTEKEEA